VTLFCGGAGSPAIAQSFKDKVIGAWTLESGSENFPDGKKSEHWATGNLILDPSGHLSFFLNQHGSSPGSAGEAAKV
jgi:hypothetical protein